MRLIPDSKITIPERPLDFVERAALRAELDQISDVGLVCAPPGYGKTVLLSDWALTSREVDTAWVSLDRDDNDPSRLWSAVVAALAQCSSAPPAIRLRASWGWPAGGQTEFLAQLVNVLGEAHTPLRLVLDDLHELSDPRVLHGVQALLRDRPKELVLVLSSRFDPLIGLYRFRLAKQLRELRMDRLRFSHAETRALMEMVRVRLTDTQIATLHQRTDGWPAGLRLAALALSEISSETSSRASSETSDVDEFLAEFSGSERSVAEYLVEEVFSSLSEDTLEFLRKTSVSELLPAELAVQLSGREEAGSILHQLERKTGVVWATGLNHDTYRLQPLLRSYLEADLKRHGAATAARLHGIAARWWANADRPVTALEQAVRSADTALLSDLLHHLAVPLLLRGEHGPLWRALRAQGERAVASDPWLSVASALVRHEVGEWSSAPLETHCPSSSPPVDSPAEWAILHLAAEEFGALPRTGIAPAIPHDLGFAEPGLEALAWLVRGTAHLREPRTRARARGELESALALARKQGYNYLALQCLTMLGSVAGAESDLPAMRQAAEEALDYAARYGWRNSMWAIGGSAMLGYAALLQAEPNTAERLAADALALDTSVPPRLRFALRSEWGAALMDIGERARGLTELRRARSELGDNPAAPEELAAAAMLGFSAALRLGHHTEARAVRSWLVERIGDVGETQVMRAYTDAAVGRNKQARATLRSVFDGDSTLVLAHNLVDAWLLEATLALLAEERAAARLALHAALAIAEPLNLLRPFTEASPTLCGLLVQQFGAIEGATSFVRRALAVRRGNSEPITAVLSQRELTVLSMLPSLLSLEEIAAELTVSVNTIKSHVRSIYSKLDAGSRRAAVLTAYERGLIISAHSS